MQNKPDPAESEKLISEPGKEKVLVDYIKSNTFRSVHADGVIGGLTPSLDINLNFYSQRLPIPTQSAFAVTADGKLGKEIPDERISRHSFIRELEVSVFISINQAEFLITWLGEQIKDAKELIAKDIKSNLGGE